MLNLVKDFFLTLFVLFVIAYILKFVWWFFLILVVALSYDAMKTVYNP